MTKLTITLSLALLLLPVAGWSDPTLTVVGPSGPVVAGTSFWVDVNISDATDVYAYQFDLTFPATLLAAVNAADGDFLPAADLFGPIFFDIDPGGGLIDAVANSLTGNAPGASGAGLLARVEFQALVDGTANIEPLNLILLDSNLEQVPNVSGVGASVVITPAGPTPVPEPGSWILLGSAAMAVILWRRSKVA